MTYDSRAIEDKWLPVWQSLDPFRAGDDEDDSRERRYLLDMFAYPSGDLHMGHAEAYAFGDLLARYWTLRGYRVLHPIGWDAFGLPAENAAIARGADPAQWTNENIAQQAESFRRYAVSVDWSRRLHSCDPEFYRWTQWLFLRMRERGLAYRATAPQDGSVRYHLRDWLISRQRYWGCPIPVVHCDRCGEVPVPDEQLPVELPPLRGAELAPRGVPPLAAAVDWVAVACPVCGADAQRDTDTMDTFVDSSWYFLRYCSPGYRHGPVDPEAVRRWLPVDQYVGGVEHATGHLLYARFVTKVLYDLGVVHTDEPFRRLLNQGQVINQGRAMSKSLGNGVDLAEQLDAHGVDAVRLAVVFAGPPAETIEWSTVSMSGARRFLQRAWRLAGEVTSPTGADPAGGDPGLRRATAGTVAEVTRCVEGYRFNVAVSRLMALANAARRVAAQDPADPALREAVEALAVMLSVVAPYTAEEMWSQLGHPPTVARATWPAGVW